MAKTLLKKLFGGEASKVFRGMVTLALGSGLGRLITLAAMPVLTRIYAPEHFGVLSVFTALVLILAPILTLRYVLAAPLPRQDATAMNLMAVAGLALVGMTAALTLFMFLFAEPLLNQLSMQALLPWWWLVVISAFALACFEALTLWATRQRQYKNMARSQVSQHLVGTVVKLVLGLLALKPAGLLIGQMLTQSAGSITLWRSFKQAVEINRRSITTKRMKRLAAYYKDYPSYRLASQLLMIFAVQAPLLMTAWTFDAGTTGQLGLAMMALSLPANLIGGNMSKAFYAEISVIGKNQPEKIRRITFSVLKRLGVLALVPAFILLFMGERLFILVFGNDWSLAGQFASALAVYLVFQFVATPVSYLMFLYNGQRKLLFINIQRTLLILGCFFLGHQLEMPALNIITLYALVLATHFFYMTIIAIKIIKI